MFKIPLGENGGVSVVEADMPLEELEVEYKPDAQAETQDEPKDSVDKQNGDE